MNELMQRRIRERDLNHLPPEERAHRFKTFVFEALGKDLAEEKLDPPLLWDLICFANEVMGVTMIGSQDEEMIAVQKIVSNYIYSVHYSLPDNDPALGPNSLEHDQLWMDRTKAVIHGLRLYKKEYENGKDQPGHGVGEGVEREIPKESENMVLGVPFDP